MIDIAEYLEAFCKENDLVLVLSYDMPIGYESAYGTYDCTTNTIYINLELIQHAPTYEVLFYLFHELRHALQYCHTERFDPQIQKSIFYVILYNGVCYKLNKNNWLTCTLKGNEEYFTAAYLNLAYEVDANRYAYTKVKELCGESCELQELYNFWMPKVPFADDEYDKLFKKIDENT